ncbi:MAG: S8 family serine peptidase [Leptothrix sp. (in: b-proteobacteria)]
MVPRVARVAGLLILGLCAASASEARLKHSHHTEQVEGREAVANEVVVQFRGEAAAAHAAIDAQEDIDESALVGHGRHAVFHSRSKSTAQLLASLRSRPDVLYAVPNHIVRLAMVPNEPPLQFNSLWGVTKTQAPVAWDYTVGATSSVAAVLDTGIDYTHPDLAANVWTAPHDYVVTIGGVSITCPAGSHGFNAIAKTCDPMDDNDHGTHAAGTIGAVGNNGLGVVGINWTTQLMGVKMLDASGMGTLADAIDALEYTLQVRQTLGAEANVRVANASWMIFGGEMLYDQVTRALQNELLLVFAAGNSSSDNDLAPIYPQSWVWPSLLSVAATDSSDAMAYFSNRGAQTVQLGAPGMGVISTVRNGGYASLNGTSMAAPHVTGAAMLMLARDPALTAPELRNRLMATATPVAALQGLTSTGGRLDVGAAVAASSPLPGFLLYTTPNWHLSLVQGTNGQVELDVVGTNGFADPVTATLDLSSLAATVPAPTPTLPTAAVSVTGSGRLTLPLSVDASVPPGDYVVPVIASSGSQTRLATVLLSVTSSLAPDFALWASSPAVSVLTDNVVSLAVGSTTTGGFADSTTWQVSGMPLDADARLAITTLAAGDSTTLQLKADRATPPGTYPVLITATSASGALTRSMVVQLTVAN